MDQERWNLAHMFGQLKWQTTDESNCKTNVANSRARASRALSMKAGLSKKLRDRPGELTSDDVVLGLAGLDQAVKYKETNQLELSLKLYQISLELLIKILKSSSPLPLPVGFSTAAIEERVSKALSDAERIKIVLKQQLKSENIGSKRTSPKYDSTTVSDAISNVLQKLNNNDSDRTHSEVIPVKLRADRCFGSKINQSPKHGSQPISQANSATLAKENEIHQIIYRDFYVPSVNLQKTTWDDIAGLQNVKQTLQESAILPLIRPDLFTGLRKPRNVLLYGPPGTGKTLLVKAVAHESQSHLFVVTSSALTSKWLGEAEKLVRNLFLVANEASPSIIFIDEMDALLSSRKSDGEHEASRRLKTEFMIQIDGIVQLQEGVDQNNRNVLLLACTNCPWDIDSAVVRRFPRRIYVPLPDSESRKALLLHLLKKQIGNHSITAHQLDSVVQRTEGYSCSDLTSLASEAAFGPIRSMSVAELRSTRQIDIRPVEISDFDQALQAVAKSVTVQQLEKYDEWIRQLMVP